MSHGEVQGATLLKLLEPFSLIEPTMAVVQLAFDYIQALPYATGSQSLLDEIMQFQASLLINTFIRKTPVLKSTLAKLEAEGTSYVTNDALWGLLDKCIYFANNVLAVFYSKD